MENELQHHGVKGMRWGVRRYQNKDGSLTKAGQKRYNSEMEKVKAETKKIKNQQRTDAKLAKLDAAKKNLEELKKGKKVTKDDDTETDEQKRERILSNPTAKDVYENRHLFTNKEVGDLYLRLNNEENIKRLMPKEINKGKERADKIFNTIGDVTTKAVTLAKAYNAAASIINAFNGTDSVSLPKIDVENINKGNKETRKQEKKKRKEEPNKSNDSNKNQNTSEQSSRSDKSEKRNADETSTTNKTDNNTSSSSTKSKNDSDRPKGSTKNTDSEAEKVFTGTVEGAGTSSKKYSETGKQKVNDIIDAESYGLVPVSSTRNSNASAAGRSYVAGLLEAPKDDD